MHAVLVLRGADGFARNLVFANQIDLFQRYVGFGNNGAQQAAKFLSALCAATPVVTGAVASYCGASHWTSVLLGCGLEVLGIAAMTAATISRATGGLFAGSLLRGKVLLDGRVAPPLMIAGLFGLYAWGYGLVASCLTPAVVASLDEGSRAAFMQKFFAVLAAGGVVGILAAAAAQSLDSYPEGLLLAFGLFALGVAALAQERWRASRCQEDSGCAAAAAACHTGHEGARRRYMLQRAWPLVVLAPFHAAYLQWTTSWYVQTAYMDRQVLPGKDLPTCMPQVVQRLGALAAYSAFGRLWKANGARASGALPLRLAVGCFFAAAALAASAAVEVARRDWVPRKSSDPGVSSLSVLWVMPQFLLMAIAESLVYPAQAEWAGRSSFLSGLGYGVQALAAAGLGMLMPFFAAWVPETSPNDGHYERFFGLLGSLCMLAAAVFVVAPRSTWVNQPGGGEHLVEVSPSRVDSPRLERTASRP